MPTKKEVVDGKMHCSGCDTWKEFTTENFYQRANGVMETKCIECHVKASRKYRETHEKTDKQKQRQKVIKDKWYAENREIVLAKDKEKRDRERENKPQNVINGMRKCTCCNEWKEETEINFSPHKTGKKEGKFNAVCKPCNAAKTREYRKTHPLTDEQKVQKDIAYRQWRKQNMDKVRVCLKKWKSNNRLRILISDTIRRALLREGSSKEGQSIFDRLPYALEELIAYLESQFKSWMTWENWGQYKAHEWNDRDPTTWTWQIDHIIPQIALPYKSMSDENFQRCWALDNLRPLSAKQNIQEGDRGWRKRNNRALPMNTATVEAPDMNTIIIEEDK